MNKKVLIGVAVGIGAVYALNYVYPTVSDGVPMGAYHFPGGLPTGTNHALGYALAAGIVLASIHLAKRGTIPTSL